MHGGQGATAATLAAKCQRHQRL